MKLYESENLSLYMNNKKSNHTYIAFLNCKTYDASECLKELIKVSYLFNNNFVELECSFLNNNNIQEKTGDFLTQFLNYWLDRDKTNDFEHTLFLYDYYEIFYKTENIILKKDNRERYPNKYLLIEDFNNAKNDFCSDNSCRIRKENYEEEIYQREQYLEFLESIGEVDNSNYKYPIVFNECDSYNEWLIKKEQKELENIMSGKNIETKKRGRL